MKFEQGPKRAPQRERPRGVGRAPRVARLLALADRIDGMVRSNEIKDWADAARLLGITRARMTQIANLLLLAPDIQEGLLGSLSVIESQDPVTEHDLRFVLATVVWHEQRARWAEIRRQGPSD